MKVPGTVAQAQEVIQWSLPRAQTTLALTQTASLCSDATTAVSTNQHSLQTPRITLLQITGVLMRTANLFSGATMVTIIGLRTAQTLQVMTLQAIHVLTQMDSLSWAVVRRLTAQATAQDHKWLVDGLQLGQKSIEIHPNLPSSHLGSLKSRLRLDKTSLTLFQSASGRKS